METLLARRQLRWIGNVMRINDERLPKQILYGKLSCGNRDAGGQMKRHKECMKTLLSKIEILPESLEALSIQRNSWRCAYRAEPLSARKSTTSAFDNAGNCRHQLRNQNVTTEDGGFPCPTLYFLHRLHSHLRAHERKRWEEAVIIVPDGLP